MKGLGAKSEELLQVHFPVSRFILRIIMTGAMFVLFWPGQGHAYIGPGAGFAFISSFFVLFLTFILAFFSILIWPLRYLYQKMRYGRIKSSPVNRVVVLGLEGAAKPSDDASTATDSDDRRAGGERRGRRAGSLRPVS